MIGNYTETTTLTKMECDECGILFSMPGSKYNRCSKDGESWFCPNGHGRVFTESLNQKLQKQLSIERDRLTREKAAHEQAQAEINTLHQSNIKMAGKLSRVYKRVRNGICPCCKRHFNNLERHMKSKHKQ